MNIQDYTDFAFNGNKADFARAFNRLPQNVTKLFNEPDQWMIVLDGKEHYLVQIRGKRLLPE